MYRVNPVPEGASTLRAGPQVADAAGEQSRISPAAGAVASQPSPCPSPEDPLEDLIEMRYRQHLAQRALQDLFETEALQALEG